MSTLHPRAAGAALFLATWALATSPAAHAQAAPATTAPHPPAAAASAPAPALPPFATFVQGAHRIDGLLPVWFKDDKVWFEIRPEDIGRPLFLSPKLAKGFGEPGFYGGSMISRGAPWGAPHIVEFRRIHGLIQLIARNDLVRAAAGSPVARAVEAGYSPSLLGSSPVLTQPSAENRAVLIEANPIFLSDLLGMGLNLQRTYRQNYNLDGRNTAFTNVRGSADETVLEVSAHFATAGIAMPNPAAPPGTPQPGAPEFLPDARSLFLGLHYSLSRLPAQPMAARTADPRVGYFNTGVIDFTDDLARSPRQRFINRWRLEKKDPAAALSEPVKPITYTLDRNIPAKYLESITKGILEWNKAFEKIGFKDAIHVKLQPVDARYDTLDTGTASVRWMVNALPSFGAIGPSHVDPRSGEILDADIGIESLSSRNQRASRAQILARDGGGAAGLDFSALLQDEAATGPVSRNAQAAAAHDPQACDHAQQAGEQLGYALDVLAARGEIEPDSPEAEAFVQAYLFDVTMHEVGHTLGLRHNYRASRVYTDAQVNDPEFTRTHALSGSVMEYLPVNLPTPGKVGGTPFQSTLGPYDYWAIEYGYKPLPAGQTPADEASALQAIAARNAEPDLAFGTDEDAFLGLDPEALQFDLGADPLAFAARRFAIARDLFARQESRELKHSADYATLRRAIAYALRDTTRTAGVLLRQMGGVRTLRDFPGSGRDPLQPVPAAQQRAAFELLANSLLAPDSLKVSPALQRKLAPDYLDRGDASFGTEPVPTDFPVETVLLDLQRAVVAALMSDGLAARLGDAAGKFDKPADALAVGEVYGRVTKLVWADAAGDTLPRRRELQRDHVNRLATLLLRAPAGLRVETRAELRAQAVALLPRIQAAQKRPGLSEPTRLHLADCAETLRQALAAPMLRAGY